MAGEALGRRLNPAIRLFGQTGSGQVDACFGVATAESMILDIVPVHLFVTPRTLVFCGPDDRYPIGGRR